MSLDTFYNAANEVATLGSKLADGFTQYKQAIAQAHTAQVCTESFKTTLDQLDQLAEQNNADIKELQIKTRTAISKYEALGFFDKRNSSVISIMQNVTGLVKSTGQSVSEINSLTPTRQQLREQYNSCQDFKKDQDKDPAGQDEAKKTDEAAAEQPKNGENQVSDDREANVNTNPQGPNPEGQKPTAEPDATQAPTQTPGTVETAIKPRPNSLRNFSSYTYNLTLYMCTRQAYNEFINNMQLPKQGLYVVAQSGGMGPGARRGLTLSGEPGPGQEGLDYFIDDFKMTTVFPGKHGQQVSTTSCEVEFKIYEPQGFGFLPRLARLADEVIKASGLETKKNKPVSLQMPYILGIKFYGYDQDGELRNPEIENSEGPQTATPYERYFPIVVAGVKSKLDGRIVSYDWSCIVSNEQFAFSQIYGQIKSKIEIEAGTVGEALGELAVPTKRSLLGALNAEQQELEDSKRIGFICQYDIEYENGNDSPIKLSSLLDDEDAELSRSGSSGARRVEDVTPKLSIKSNTVNTKKKVISIPQGMSILSAIDQLITKSSYISRALTRLNNERIETAGRDKQQAVELQWFVVHPKTEILTWDDVKKTWSLKITYQIKTYKVPYIKTPYIDRPARYYGPVKKYDYYYTGQNTEVLSYEQKFNNLFYIIQPFSVTDDDDSRKRQSGPQPVIPDSGVNGNDLGGKINNGSRINEVVRGSVYSATDQALASMKILGDPDYMSEVIGGSIDFARGRDSSRSFTQAFGTRGSINPYYGQVFLEIKFLTSEDYTTTDTGLQDINSSLSFYGTQQQQKSLSAAGITGVIYQVTRVVSTMRRGLFHQDVSMMIVPPETLLIPGSRSQTDANQNQREQAQTTPAGTTDTRESTVNTATQPSEPAGPGATNTSSPVQSASTTRTQPLATSQVSVPTSTGSTPSDDANAGSGATRVSEGGREDEGGP